MSTKLYAVRRGFVLAPVSEADQQVLDEAPMGKVIEVSLSRPRSVKLMRFYWGLLALICRDAIPDGGGFTKDSLHAHLMIRCGYHESYVIDGDKLQRVSAQSVAGWDRFQWRRYFDAAFKLIIADIVPGISQRDLRLEVERFVGVRMAEALTEEDA